MLVSETSVAAFPLTRCRVPDKRTRVPGVAHPCPTVLVIDL